MHGYAQVQRRAFRSAVLTPPNPWLSRLTRDPAQEWAHPVDEPAARNGLLRVAVLGSCLPFLLEDLPHRLAQGEACRARLGPPRLAERARHSALPIPPHPTGVR